VFTSLLPALVLPVTCFGLAALSRLFSRSEAFAGSLPYFCLVCFWRFGHGGCRLLGRLRAYYRLSGGFRLRPSLVQAPPTQSQLCSFSQSLPLLTPAPTSLAQVLPRCWVFSFLAQVLPRCWLSSALALLVSVFTSSTGSPFFFLVCFRRFDLGVYRLLGFLLAPYRVLPLT
jgi:hypothetical protein